MDLPEIQYLVLRRATERADGVAALPDKMRRAAALGASLVARGLVVETVAKQGMPVWREDAGHRSISLVITAKGRRMIDALLPLPAGADSAAASGDGRSPGRVATKPIPVRTAQSKALPDADTKQAVIRLLKRRSGATLCALADETGWLPHSVRARLSELRKVGFKVIRQETRDGFRYRIDRSVAREAAMHLRMGAEVPRRPVGGGARRIRPMT